MLRGPGRNQGRQDAAGGFVVSRQPARDGRSILPQGLHGKFRRFNERVLVDADEQDACEADEHRGPRGQ